MQLYVRPPRGPKSVLRAFRRLTLEPGARQRVAIDLPVDALARYDGQSQREVVDPGRYQLLVGASSTDIRQSATLQVAAP